MKNRKPMSEKPYNKCLYCTFLGNGCDGPRTPSMSFDRWCEWLSDVKQLRGMTNQEIAEKASLSLATVERLLGGYAPSKDIMRSTASLLENAIVGSSSQFPCPMAFNENYADSAKKLLEKERELEHLKKTVDQIHASYQAELKTVREEAQRKIDYLLAENERRAKIIDKLIK